MNIVTSTSYFRSEMGQFQFRNWNRNRPLFKLDGMGRGMESITNFSVGIGIDPTQNWNRNRSISALMDSDIKD